MKYITMSVGSGGVATNGFIKKLILSKLGNPILDHMGDAARLDIGPDVAFTTDSFVVQPEFFPGGDIGKLAVYGTCNDLAVSGAKPQYLSLSFIIPEGYRYDHLEQIIESIRAAAADVGVLIVCGDTKVVERGALNGLVINTSGVGQIKHYLNDYESISVGDSVILTSDIARHGVSVMLSRDDLSVGSDIDSDCGNLYDLFIHCGYGGLKFARDATRGGVAAVLHEIMEVSQKGIILDEEHIPLSDQVKYFCELMGFDPLAVANEGVAVLIASEEKAESIVAKLSQSKMGASAKVVGKVTIEAQILLNTAVGGKRFVEMPSGELLPRIC